jgi:hypothetical protein
MPTLYHNAAPDKVLTIHGLDANPVYLPLYVEAENRGIFIHSAEFCSSTFPNRQLMQFVATGDRLAEWTKVPIRLSTLPFQVEGEGSRVLGTPFVIN